MIGHHQRFDCYSGKLMVDKNYMGMVNRKFLKEKNIRLVGRPLGRPAADERRTYQSEEWNPVEEKFGQAKRAYGLSGC